MWCDICVCVCVCARVCVRERDVGQVLLSMSIQWTFGFNITWQAEQSSASLERLSSVQLLMIVEFLGFWHEAYCPHQIVVTCVQDEFEIQGGYRVRVTTRARAHTDARTCTPISLLLILFSFYMSWWTQSLQSLAPSHNFSFSISCNIYIRQYDVIFVTRKSVCERMNKYIGNYNSYELG
jgi:hypothetical protein